MKRYDVIVIGSGQAGLAAGYYLMKKGVSFVLLDKGSEAGEVWRNRYDSLVLFTPRFYSSMPGMPLNGEPGSYAAKNEIAEYLKTYAEQFALPIHYDTEVLSLKKTANRFLVETNQGRYESKKVIIATGPFQKPYIPSISAGLPKGIKQIHTAHYRNEADLQDGSVLVIGAGNSGAQIAVELAQDRDVYLSVGHTIKYMPLMLLGKSIFWWFRELGVMKANLNSAMGKFISRQPDPIFGFDLKNMIREGNIQLKARTKAVTGDSIMFEDNSLLQVQNIVWATGFHSDYSWIQIPGVINGQGKPIHERGISPVSGIYFVGLPWQYRRGSALIGGVGQDAEFIVNRLI
ncbi:flavin-containing monooxygenase [Paenibacillus beijingensis]|uniref:Oxidoreductase n=1 Tax=Paenibacillus beijingensis TaxID=1126833 RepID=A0A0D5NMA4_9BACL|nr:NAD(P)/FAD-dependent oxidoreductase [Paenibacillus beijingensis]AJY76107.1 oxidoreductase [Paenibacillus beijingensis]